MGVQADWAGLWGTPDPRDSPYWPQGQALLAPWTAEAPRASNRETGICV